MAFKRYDVHWGKLDLVRGNELRKTRPGVIVSLDVLNRAVETVVVCPLTTQLHRGWRTRLQIRIGNKPAEIAADQTRTVSKSRLGKKLGSLSARDAAALRRLLGEMYATPEDCRLHSASRTPKRKPQTEQTREQREIDHHVPGER